MKKCIWVLPILLLTSGCFSYNKTLTCSIQEDYEEIDTEISVVTEFKKGRTSKATATATMNFDSAEAAQSYYDSYEGDKDSLQLKDNLLIITSEQTFETTDDSKSRQQVKEYFENSGYTCK